MKKYIKLVLFGLLTWIIPFFAGFIFYSPQGELLINQLFFKSIMVVIGSLVGAILLVLHFKTIFKKQIFEAIIVGILWFGMNILLDILILVPMAKMTIYNYLSQIGLGYLSIPIMTIAIGFVSEYSRKGK